MSRPTPRTMSCEGARGVTCYCLWWGFFNTCPRVEGVAGLVGNTKGPRSYGYELLFCRLS